MIFKKVKGKFENFQGKDETNDRRTRSRSTSDLSRHKRFNKMVEEYRENNEEKEHQPKIFIHTNHYLKVTANEKISSFIQGLIALPCTMTNFENTCGGSTPLRKEVQKTEIKSD